MQEDLGDKKMTKRVDTIACHTFTKKQKKNKKTNKQKNNNKKTKKQTNKQTKKKNKQKNSNLMQFQNYLISCNFRNILPLA